MRILVTGASGLVGGLAVRLAAPKHEVLAGDRSLFDIRDRQAVFRAFREFSPEAVLHCAAYTDVDGAERAPAKALDVNATGARVVAEGAREVEALILYVSTDYVFDGERADPYREEHPLNPLSSYARSKLEGERAVAEASPERHLIVRTGWLYGPEKGFVDWARSRLVRGEELPVVEDQTGSPTSARELASAMLTLVEQRLSGVFHFVNSGEATWLTVGNAIAEDCALSPRRIRAIRAAELNRPAARPRYSALSVERYEKATGRKVTGWRDALRQYLREGSKGESQELGER
jgi:dTDP-4-dehydrorhamnose reductase